jgi:hypothetical protein
MYAPSRKIADERVPQSVKVNHAPIIPRRMRWPCRAYHLAGGGVATGVQRLICSGGPMEHLIQFIAECFVAMWRSDDRAEARQFTVGCLVLLLMVVLVIAVVWWLS